jgi:sulfide:quinone oxidoreductase
VHSAALKLARGESRGLVFCVPGTVHWSLPAYELALLAAGHLADVGATGAPVHLVTAEQGPMDVFGADISQYVRNLLRTSGVRLHTQAPARVVKDGLALVDGTIVAADDVVSLPAFEVPPIEGLPQGPHGFVDTDSRMRVESCDGVYVAGDASWFPVKQGGLAAQQADVAAAAIAHSFDPEIESEPFRPRLRAALLTADGPLYLRRGEGLETAASDAPLWWPPGKVAGRYLTPYIAAKAMATNQPDPALVDLDRPAPDDVAGHREATELALHAADADARLGDYAGALRWLAVAERLDLSLPAEYSLQREQWRRRVA